VHGNKNAGGHVEAKNVLTNLGQNKSGNVFLLIEHKIAEKHLYTSFC
jgi:hypothetical protein